jgi:hypothetical protein
MAKVRRTVPKVKGVVARTSKRSTVVAGRREVARSQQSQRAKVTKVGGKKSTSRKATSRKARVTKVGPGLSIWEQWERAGLIGSIRDASPDLSMRSLDRDFMERSFDR